MEETKVNAYDWPCYNTGERVKIGDTVKIPNGFMQVEAIEFYRDCAKNCMCAAIKDGPNDNWSNRIIATSDTKLDRILCDANNQPILKGETVYLRGARDNTKSYTVVKTCVLKDNAGKEFLLGPAVDLRADDTLDYLYVYPYAITHEKPEQPDSWEKWGDDFIKPPCVYCKNILDIEFDEETELEKAFNAQIAHMKHRAKALAEKVE